MDNNPKKSKAFIITFIIVILFLLVGYYFYANRAKIFNAKGITSISKIFAPLLGSSKNNSGWTPITDTNTNNPNPIVSGVVLTDTNNNKIVRAEAGENLKKGDVLYISGFNKNKDPIVMRAIANDRKKSLVFGVAGEDIEMGSMGNIIIEGILTGVPTNKNEGTLWAVFNTLYLSDKNYGEMTKNPPIAPSFIVPVGSVLKVDPIDGHIKIGGFSNNQITNISDQDISNLKIFNSAILNEADANLRDYWNSVFGGGVSNNNNNLNTNNLNNNGFNLTPISIPDNNTNYPAVTPTTTPSNLNPSDTSTTTTTPSGITTTQNSCDLIEKNPLVFTPDQRARLDVLLRRFYLISSSLRTTEDLTALNNEMEQNQNFISQIEDLTQQCYNQVTPDMMIANSWVRHGNPWYTKTSGGSFPYTSDNTTGYLDYKQLDGGETPAGYKVVSGYYYGTLTQNVSVASSSGTTTGVVGDSCDKFNNFQGYGLSDQINDRPGIYVGHYCVGGGTNVFNVLGGAYTGMITGGPAAALVGGYLGGQNSCGNNEAVGGGFPGDSIISYENRVGTSTQIDQSFPDKQLLTAGCNWKDGVILDNTERLLNIW